MILGKYSFGIGDRFGHQGKAQLAAIIKADAGAGPCACPEGQGQPRVGFQTRFFRVWVRFPTITPVWNKSNREHTIIGTKPARCPPGGGCGRRRLRLEGALLRGCRPHRPDQRGWLSRRERFLHARCGRLHRPAGPGGGRRRRSSRRTRTFSAPIRSRESTEPIALDESRLRSIAAKYLVAVQQAGNTFRHIEAAQGRGPLRDGGLDGRDRHAADARRACWSSWRRWPTRAFPPRPSPRSSAAGSTRAWTTSATWASSPGSSSRTWRCFASRSEQFGLPANLKLSVHSGSDKFSIYGPIRKALQQIRRRRAPQDRRHHLAGGTDRPGPGRRRRPGHRQGDLRPGAGSPRRALRPVRHGHRHRHDASFRTRARSAAGTASSSPRPCVTTGVPAVQSAAFANSCTSATRSPPRWARASPTPWTSTRRSSRKTSRPTSTKGTSAPCFWRSRTSQAAASLHKLDQAGEGGEAGPEGEQQARVA